MVNSGVNILGTNVNKRVSCNSALLSGREIVLGTLNLAKNI